MDVITFVMMEVYYSFVSILLVIIFLVEFNSTQKQSSVEIVDPRDPEPDVTYEKIPGDESPNWENVNSGAFYTGHLFADRLAFYWIVDIRRLREQFKDRAYRSVGNLISDRQVLTSCRGAKFVQLRISSRAHHGLVFYATQYLQERHAVKLETDSYDSEGVVGWRTVVKVHYHKNCEHGSLTYDLALLELKESILPIVPYIGMMPVLVKFPVGIIQESQIIRNLIENRWICHVGSFGRRSFNLQEDPHGLDYKVQYRVYALHWSSCRKFMRLLCGPDEDCNGADDEGVLACLTTRAKVGSVCDHDRGAPVVCEGFVHGLIVRGAQYVHCNNLIHVPFVVQRLDTMGEYFEEVIRKKVREAPDSDSKSIRVYPSMFLHLDYLILSIVMFTL